MLVAKGTVLGIISLERWGGGVSDGGGHWHWLVISILRNRRY